jgi:hypothetical protein
MKKLMATAIAGLAAATVVLSAQQTTEQPKQDPKSETKAPPTVAGKWALSVQTQNGTTDAGLDLKVDGKKVTGTIASSQGETTLAGEFADGKLTFSIAYQGNNGEVQLTFTGTLKADGTLAGTIASPGGELAWTATRPK